MLALALACLPACLLSLSMLICLQFEQMACEGNSRNDRSCDANSLMMATYNKSRLSRALSQPRDFHRRIQLSNSLITNTCAAILASATASASS